MDRSDVTDTGRLQQVYARRVASRQGDASCVTPEAILAVVRREGPETERLATLEHVMACAACHREYEWLSAVNEAGLEAAGAAPARARAWWQRAPLALAASLAAAVGAAVVVSNAIRTGADRERGSAGDITLVAPDARAAADAPVSFTWRALPGASRYVLEVQQPDGSVALADTTADTVAVVAAGRLRPDAYRWWVREVTDGAEPRSSALLDLRLTSR